MPNSNFVVIFLDVYHVVDMLASLKVIYILKQSDNTKNLFCPYYIIERILLPSLPLSLLLRYNGIMHMW